MEYMVKAIDGTEYGPVTIDVLKVWAQEDRIRPHSTVKDFRTGQVLVASQIPGLFPTTSQSGNPYASPPPPTSYYASQIVHKTTSGEDGKSELWGSIIRSVAAVAIFFFLQGLGLIFAIYAMVYAVQAKSHGNKFGIVAILVAGVALAIVGIGWVLRLNGSTV